MVLWTSCWCYLVLLMGSILLLCWRRMPRISSLLTSTTILRIVLHTRRRLTKVRMIHVRNFWLIVARVAIIYCMPKLPLQCREVYEYVLYRYCSLEMEFVSILLMRQKILCTRKSKYEWWGSHTVEPIGLFIFRHSILPSSFLRGSSRIQKWETRNWIGYDSLKIIEVVARRFSSSVRFFFWRYVVTNFKLAFVRCKLVATPRIYQENKTAGAACREAA